ncbi:sn-glycerol-3-phosphate ABC transporter ATP-binding protein UgpC [bacterium]|nr:sn-glycerol-3-phosphate ABC transporter ATP-binding protein UgpC [bacterium]
MAEVRLEHIRKRYDRECVIDDLNLVVTDGEFMVLVGPSGCGKSTTLRMIAGLETVTAGTITIGSRIVNDIPPKDRDIAMVFQNYALYPHMDVYDNMAFGLKLRRMGRTEIEQRVREAARILEIENLLERKPRELSGGQRQRVALGRALVRKPQVFLFDEPLSNLDAKLRVQMRTEINRLHERLRTTVIYVTHDQTEAMTMGNRITLLDHGSIQQIGTPTELYRYPQNLFVAGFIGSPPMNFFPVRLEKDSARIKIKGDGFSFSLPTDKCSNMDRFDWKEAILGLRPEDICIIESGFRPPDFLHTNWTACVDVCEHMGSEQLVYGFLPDSPTRFVARTLPDIVFQSGDRIMLFPEYKHLLFFPHSD